MKSITLSLAIILIGAFSCLAQTKQVKSIKVGAAKLNITPSKEELGANSLGIHDSVYCRAIVIDNGVTASAL